MEKNDPQRTGISIYDASQNKGGEKWKYYVNSSVSGSAVIDREGVLYVGSAFDGVHAVYPNGTRKWHIPKINSNEREYQSLALASDGTVYLGTMEHLYAINNNGTIKWTFEVGGNFFSDPAIDMNDVLYTAVPGTVYAIYPNGTLKWEFPVQRNVFNLALDYRENVYFVNDYPEILYCLTPKGVVNWTFEWPNLDPHLVIGADNTIYVQSGSELKALYPNGTVKWSIEFPLRSYRGRPSVAPDGTIIISGSSEYVAALDPQDGHLLWTYQLGQFPLITPVSDTVFSNDGTIFFVYSAYGQSQTYLCALNPDGTLKWQTHLTSEYPSNRSIVFASPSIGSDGTVYATSWFITQSGDDHGYIHAIGVDEPKAPEPPTCSGRIVTRLLRNYTLSICSTIPGGGDVYYFVDWNDTSKIYNYKNQWLGPFPSGAEVELTHHFIYLGKHPVKVMAKGSDGLCSPWTTFNVRVSLFPLFGLILERIT